MAIIVRDVSCSEIVHQMFMSEISVYRFFK